MKPDTYACRKSVRPREVSCQPNGWNVGQERLRKDATAATTTSDDKLRSGTSGQGQFVGFLFIAVRSNGVVLVHVQADKKDAYRCATNRARRESFPPASC